MPHIPLLSIGMPVYNADRFLAKSIQSLLSQSFTDFELIISDNASTDRTEQICRDYASTDKRIRYFRNAKNMGAGCNFRRVYGLATGEYYKQAAHDDFCEPSFCETCVHALQHDRELTVAYTKTRVVNAGGEFLEDYECPLRIDDDDPVVRFADLVLTGHRCFPIFGVHRMSALKQLPPQGSFAHADRILLAQLGLMGRFYEAPERLFISTRHDCQSVWTMPSRTNSKSFRLTRKPGTLPNMEWWDPHQSRAITFPEWNALRQYYLSVHHSSLTIHEKMRAYHVMSRWIAQYRRRLMGDVVLAADQMLWNWQSSRALAQQHVEEDITIQVQGGKLL